MSTPPDDDSLADLWDAARHLCRWLLAICGCPAALVAQVRLPAKRRRAIGFWLRPVEALVRRLLAAEAARIVRDRPGVPPPRRRAPGQAAHAPFCRVEFPDPDDSETWAVRFAVLEPPGRAGGMPDHRLPRLRDLTSHADILAPAQLELGAARHRERLDTVAGPLVPELLPPRPRPSPAAGTPWRLARRIEALIRVLEDPRPFARRLAHRLRQDPGPVRRLCRPPPPPEPGRPPPYGHSLLREASALARARLSGIGGRTAGLAPMRRRALLSTRPAR